MHTSEPQQSLSLVHESPVPRQPQVPWLLHTLGAQQSELLLHDVPAPAHPHVPVLVSQLSEPQQSALLEHPCPFVAHPQVPSRHTPLQQSLPVEHELPSIAQPPVPPTPPSPPPPPLLSTHFLLLGSQVYEPQQSSSVLQSPPTPAHAGWQLPLAQLLEQQSPFVLQQS